MSDIEPPSLGIMSMGYPLEIMASPVDKKYLCCHCHLILREPMQSFCGHRFCKNCTQILLQDGEVHCSECLLEGGTPSEFTIIKQGQIFPDNAMKREFLSWKVNCPNPGCTWAGTFREYELHTMACEARAENCGACGRTVPSARMQQHRSKECPMRTEQCPNCHVQVPVLQSKEHGKMCPKMSVKCDACEKEMLREKLEQHYAGDCSVKRISCPYKCGDYVDPDNLEQHEQNNVVEHVRSINRRVMMMEGRPPTAATAGASSMNAQQLSKPVQVSREMIELTTKVVELERKVTTSLGDTSAQAMSPQASVSNSASGDNVTELEKRVRILEEKVKVFMEVTGVLESSVEKSQALVTGLNRSVTETSKGFEKRTKEVEKGLAVKDLVTAELEQRIRTLETSSYDGVLLWKITNFGSKRQDAMHGRTTSIYSPPFYTSRNGYKMCARMYLNGDGMGKGSYISLFFVVMRNEYDALMRWPFQQKVSMVLIDQNNIQHIVDAFRPDPSSSSFRRPQSEMNIASGCPLFCPLSSLTSDQYAYVKDDTMYIKIIVDTETLNG